MHNWMRTLGFKPNKVASGGNILLQKRRNDTNDGAKRITVVALLAVKDAAVACCSRFHQKRKSGDSLETVVSKIITEVRDFACENAEVKKLVDVDSQEAVEKAKAPSGPVSAVDAVLEQIKKRQKLSVMDKTKKDWGQFKENKGLDEELDAYKKSSNQYLDKQSFLHRTDYREFERERDVRLALQSKRKTE
ncbi:hypothetical protein GIB67_011325 [Kingdonia uniflora]|uniref:BCNT-C domain-containing protein n=1 Tax=Kingdonia uniflora TaxID=39325 RepID=A0A7J7MNW3_9MAGN|nr:hypothetical protein GIB67_011325 [Kingdonia uniflora]